MFYIANLSVTYVMLEVKQVCKIVAIIYTHTNRASNDDQRCRMQPER